MKPDILFSILAGLLNVLAFGIYNWKTLKGKADPNIAAWALWSFITVLNFTTYKSMSADWVMSVLPTVSSLQCILTLILSLKTGRWKGFDRYDMAVLAIGILVAVLWRFTSATFSNMMLQVGITIGFIPQFKSTWRKPSSESALCWFLWTVSFIIQAVVVILRWNGQMQDLVYPLNCLWLHFIVTMLAQRKTTNH